MEIELFIKTAPGIAGAGLIAGGAFNIIASGGRLLYLDQSVFCE